MRRSGRPTRVRFSPKATVGDRGATCRDGPIAFILHRKKQRAFSPISKALVLLLLLGSDRQSRQLIEQRLGLFQIERIEAFGEPAIARSEQIKPSHRCAATAARVMFANKLRQVSSKQFAALLLQLPAL